ncbi:MAG: sugar-binding domain-containing protein [Enterocloster aldenensis]
MIAAAIGDSKVEAIKAALKSGKIDILVTDLDTAKQI